MPAQDPPDGLEALDALAAGVAEAETALRVAETERIIECLEAEGFTTHNVESMTGLWSHRGPSPSESLAHLADPVGLPDAAEAEVRALGYWLGYADTYGDQEGIDRNEVERSTESEEDTGEWTVIDLSQFEAAGAGWDDLPAIDQMAWETAYRGADWAATSKAASVLSSDDWEALGLPGGEWVSADTVADSPGGCRGEVLTGLHGEPRQVDSGFGSQWVWGPAIELDARDLASLPFTDLPEADDLLSCLADAGHEEWGFSEFGGLDLGDEWRDRYLPESAEETADGVTEYRQSDITDADRERYETVKAEEFAAAAVIAECDATAGYSAAAERQYVDLFTDSLLDAAPASQAYLAELETALADLT